MKLKLIKSDVIVGLKSIPNTTMKVCRDLGLNFVGIDLDEKALDYSKLRVNWGSGLETEYEYSDLIK